MSAKPILRITDGTTPVNLLDLRGWLLKDWQPAVAAAKSGGVFRSNPLTNGRKLAYRKMDNAIDTFNLVSMGSSQDTLIATIRELEQLLEKATDYWTSNWQGEPVWIEASGPNESQTRYAVIVDYKLTGFGNPYTQPFFNCDNPATEAVLAIEHTYWQETVPGAYGNCVPLECKTDYPTTRGYTAGSYYPAHSLADVSYSDALNSCLTSDHELYVGYMGAQRGLMQSGIVFENVTIAHLLPTFGISPINKATLTLKIVRYGGSGDTFYLRVNGQKPENGRINTVTLVTAGHGYNPITTYVSTSICPGAHYWPTIVPTVLMPAGRVTALTIKHGGSGCTAAPILHIKDTTNPFNESATATCTITTIGAMAGLFSGQNADFVERLRTTAYTDYEVSIQSVMAGTALIDIDVTDIVKEIVDDENWTSGSNICLFVEMIKSMWDNNITFESFDEGGASPPKLHIHYSTETKYIGQETTCSQDVYVVNKCNTAPVNYIVYYDDDAVGDKYSLNMADWDYTGFNMPLFQNHAQAGVTPAHPDMLFFGSCPAFVGDTNYGPFNNLIFDLYPDINPDVNGTWYYWNGAWTEFDVSGTVTNELCGDNLVFGGLSKSGVISMVWRQPSDWIECGVTVGDIGLVTGYWVMFHIDSVGGAPTTPLQQHRGVYTANKPYVDIGEEYVPGDVPALARIDFAVASCYPHTMNTLVMGLRSLSRGEDFSAYLNASDKQQAWGVEFLMERYSKAGGDFPAYVHDSIEAPTGRSLELANCNPILHGKTDLFDICSWTISTPTAQQYIGTYHAYVRCNFSSAWAIGRAKLRLRATLGPEYNVSYSDTNTVALNDECCAIDLGQISIIPLNIATHELSDFRVGRHADVIGNIKLYLQCYGDTYLYPYIFSPGAHIYDVVLIPADEWSGNFGMPGSNEVVGYGDGVVIDAISTPKQYRATEYIASHNWMSRELTGSIRAEWTRIASGEPIFQANADQRLWFMQYKHGAGTNPAFPSYFENCGAISAERSARYIVMRGKS